MGKKDKDKSRRKGKPTGKPGKKDRARDRAPIASDAAAGLALLPDGVRSSGGPPLSAGAATRGAATRPQPRSTIEPVELAARLASLGRILQRQLAWGDMGEGLTRSRLSALALLVLGGPKTLGELAAAERVRPPTMTRLVRAMERDGLVTRERHPEDGRSIIVRATASGERRLDEGRVQQLAPLAGAIADLDPAERRQLEDAADRLGRLLRDASRESPEPAG